MASLDRVLCTLKPLVSCFSSLCRKFLMVSSIFLLVPPSIMIEGSRPPILEHFCPLFIPFVQMGSLFCLETHPQNPALYSAVTPNGPNQLQNPSPPRKTALPPPLPRLPFRLASARPRRARRWKRSSKWSSSTCRAPARGLQRKCGSA